ncbi:hypothetical protein TWF694_004368 [Orbilia ellipsospora]|uniref:Uncharacterized protein n=1 Tax=Orbilia ellipsospora TaxID=2528407 RepID=A0AAV9WXV9_9PEZI
MRLGGAIKYLIVGLCIFPGTSVYAKVGSLSSEDFVTWALAPENEQIWKTISQDLEYLVYSARVERPLNLGYAADGNPSSLATVFDDIRTLFLRLHRRSIRSEGSEQDSSPLSIASADSGLIADMKSQAEEAVASGVTSYWLTALKSVESIFNWKVSLRKDWLDKRKARQDIFMPTNAVESLVDYIQTTLDLNDFVQVAMWVLAADYNDGNDTITYDTSAKEHLRAAFKSLYDGFRSMAELITNIYHGAQQQLADPLNQEILFEVENALRRLQNFCFAYQRIFQ